MLQLLRRNCFGRAHKISFCIQKPFLTSFSPHLFSHYGPYSDSKRRHARNWLRDNLPGGSYRVIINTKRAIFGPHEGPYED